MPAVATALSMASLDFVASQKSPDYQVGLAFPPYVI